MVKPIQLMSLNDYVADLLEFVRKAQEETEIVQGKTLKGILG